MTLNSYADLHHLKPIHLPEIPLNLELHRRPKWPEALPPPDVREVVEAAIPSALPPRSWLRILHTTR